MSMPSRPAATSRSSNVDQSLFKNTSRRWIFNENQRLRERYVKFNAAELQRAAANAMNREQLPVLVKIAEGGFNKVFLASADDGQEVIARIPTAIAGPPHYSTASEVATINFLRDVLGVPVPRILDYSTESTNPVGAEYIIMERVHGESLASRWLTLSAKEVTDVMVQLAEIERKIFSFKFPGYGNLYHKGDIREDAHIVLQLEDYCIGPVAKRQYWHDERSQMKLDRGPWERPDDCLTSAARPESARPQHARPQPRRRFLLPTDYNIHPSDHASLLSQFEQIAPFLVPEDQGLSAPTLRHPDLSSANILLVPGSSKIASIIDWQDAAIFPLFMQAGYPAFCEHDMSRPQSLQAPSLPGDFDTLSPEEQIQAKSQLRREDANLYYTAATGVHNDNHLRALKIPHLGMRQYLIQQTGYPWDADVINLRAALVGITTPHVWSDISSQPCPISFSEQERAHAMDESAEWNESETLLSRIRENLDVDLEGGRAPENFEWATHQNARFRMEMVRQADAHEREIVWRNWPFKDDDDLSSPPELGYEQE